MRTRKYGLALLCGLTVLLSGLLFPASAATIHGTVTDSNGPVGGVRVTVHRTICLSLGYLGLGCTSWSDDILTETDGTYSFIDLYPKDPIGEYGVSAQVNWEDDRPYVYQQKNIEITGEEQSVQVDFQLELASTISGTLRKANGEMLTSDEKEHIKVEVHPAEGGAFYPYKASIESDGSYNISGLPSGRSFNVSVQGDGTVNYIPEWSIGAISVPDTLELAGAIDITSPGSQINGVDFQLDSGATVTGKFYQQPEVSSYSYKVVVTETTAEDACSMASDSILNKYTVYV
ncbi:MAG: carboxypeptidase-like regulatory domain-containing protein [Candidatus Electrothrix sp. GW3-4]|uniref:carboxypeptidase-like regulatory domain-containing protein n=1 Tax=Candidatus Electrothrix sp. GW3-4 TaxID=3126740 RepID=UPI0030D0CECC